MTDEQILQTVAAENFVSVDDIKRPGRSSERMWLIRAQAARRLRGRHYSTTEIGVRLNRDHSTVISMLGGGKKKKHG